MYSSNHISLLRDSAKGVWIKQAWWIAAMILLVTAPVIAQKKPNFSGTWELDKAKSQLRPQSQLEHLVMVIEHQEPKLKVNATERHPQPIGERNYVLQLTIDGSEISNVLGQGTIPQSSRTSWEAAKLVTKWNQASESTPISGSQRGRGLPRTETWTLAEDGETLTITGSAQRGDGQPSTWKYVMAKKSR
jgi:hypothetical protein